VNEFLRKRIERKLETLSEERVYQVLDYIEFLESRYAERASNDPSPLQKLAERVEDTLRAGKASASVVKSTMDAMSAASRLMGGLTAAGKAVLDEVTEGTKGTKGTQGPASPPSPSSPPSP